MMFVRPGKKCRLGMRHLLWQVKLVPKRHLYSSWKQGVTFAKMPNMTLAVSRNTLTPQQWASRDLANARPDFQLKHWYQLPKQNPHLSCGFLMSQSSACSGNLSTLGPWPCTKPLPQMHTHNQVIGKQDQRVDRGQRLSSICSIMLVSTDCQQHLTLDGAVRNRRPFSEASGKKFSPAC